MSTSGGSVEENRVERDRQRIVLSLVDLRHRSRVTLHDRTHRVRVNLVLALQAGVAAALAWVAAHEVLGNPEPVFAPIAAVGTLASGVGQRLRRTVELIIGVAVGIAIGDFLIFLVGTGPWQLAVVVILAIIVSIFLGGGPAVVTQAAATAVLIATLSPTVRNLEFPRVMDALVGGLCGLIVLSLLLPLNPLRVVERAAGPGLNALAEELDATAKALTDRDPHRAQAALDRLTRVEKYMEGLSEAMEGARETATLSPARWHRRGALARYVASAEYVNHAVHNSGALVRRAVTLLEDGEPVPEPLPSAVSLLGEAVRVLHHELSSGLEPEAARERSLRAVSEAGRAYEAGVGFSGSVVVAQVRTTGSDLLRAAGIERQEANRLVRKAVGSHSEAARGESHRWSPSATR